MAVSTLQVLISEPLRHLIFYSAGTCIEKTESGEFGGDGKESKGTSETEVAGQPV